MKKICFAVLYLVSGSLQLVWSQNVGIGIASPNARLHVADSAVLFSGPATVPATTLFAPPASGAGTRLFWYPQKAAFRTGVVTGTFWDKDSIGKYSVATGYDTKAKGSYSVSMGLNSEATGDYALAIGHTNFATGVLSTTLGGFNLSSGEGSVSLGYNNQSAGAYAVSAGFGNKANGAAAVSMGSLSEATAADAVAIGSQNLSTAVSAITLGVGNQSTANGAVSLGIGNFANTYGMTAVGMYNEQFWVWRPDTWVATDPLFVVGNGQANYARSTALLVNKAGMVGIGTTEPAVSSATSGLHVKNSGYMQLRLESSASSAGIEMRAAGAHSWEMQTSVNSEWFLYDRTASQYRLLANSTGEIGIGTITPSQKLHVNGPVLATAFNLISDARLKTAVFSISDPLGRIAKIRGVFYSYVPGNHLGMDLPSGTQAGVIAQEVEAVLPEAVTTNADGFKSVDYTKLVPLLIEGMKAQQQEITELKKLVEQLLRK